MIPKHLLGKEGEQLAVDYLKQNGFSILNTNWRFKKAEIDIIALKGDTLAIVEVKTRSYDTIINPEEAVNPKKIKLLVSAANEYVIQKDLVVDVRFDIVAIVKQKHSTSINHIEGAFLPF